MKKRAIIGIIIMSIIVILQILGLLSPLILIIGGTIGVYLFITGTKKEKIENKEQNTKN